MADSSWDNAMLMDMIHEALKKWKKAEYAAAQEDTSYLSINRNAVRSEALRSIYLELIREAKRRGASLTKEQLIDRILYTCDDIKTTNNQHD